MKPGKEYELFVYEKFKRFFKDFFVKFDDKFQGKESSQKRQIDISIRGTVNKIDLLYLVQCKDHNRPADLVRIGEFASVLRDVGASKGFMICASGFAKTIHEYARANGIELLTVEDINSEKWSLEIQIPIIYIQNNEGKFSVGFEIICNEALAEKNKEPITITPEDSKYFSLDSGKTVLTLSEYLKKKSAGIDVYNTNPFDASDSSLMLKFCGVWVQVKDLKVYSDLRKTYYLKYVTPDEYSHIVDHLRNSQIPLHMSVKKLPIKLDESYTQIDKDQIPITSGFSFEIESNPPSFENIEVIGFSPDSFS